MQISLNAISMAETMISRYKFDKDVTNAPGFLFGIWWFLFCLPLQPSNLAGWKDNVYYLILNNSTIEEGQGGKSGQHRLPKRAKLRQILTEIIC